MCGITGFNWEDAKLVRKMTSKISHRGPDDSGIYTDSGISLGHRRLSILDLSKNGRQPMFNESESLALVFNGEIYNHKAIKANLKKRHEFKSESDSEVILHGYEEMGEKIFSELDGMFAIALWDSKKKKLFLARDRIGQKPLYYYKNGSKILFSSEIKSILEWDEVDRKINNQALSNYLCYRFSAGEETMFEGIKKVRPGTYLVIQKGKLEREEFWKLPKFSGKEKRDTDKIDSLISKSVEKRLMADVPLGVFLSGGLDSSTIVAYMSQFRDKIKTYSVGFNEKNDENKYAEIVSEKFNTEHKNVYLDLDITKVLPKIIWNYDEPIADPASAPTYLLSEEVSKEVKVALSGEGGDEAFGGYHTFNYIKYINQLNATPLFLRKIGALKSELFSNFFVYPRKQKLKLGSEILKEKEAWSAHKKLFYFPYDEKSKKEILENKEVDFEDPIDKYYKNNNLYSASQNYYFKDWLPNDLLMKADKMGMAHALEIRVPFLDREIIEYMAKLKNSEKVNRKAFKEVVGKRLPREIMNRKKQGFTLPLTNWTRREDFRSKVRQQLEDLKKRKIFSSKEIDKLIERPMEFRNDHRSWVLMNFEIWSKIYLDKRDYGKIKV